MTTQKINTSIKQLERIVNAAKRAIGKDSSLSQSILLTTTRESNTHTDCDMISATVKSNYAECEGENVFWNWM